MQQKKNLIFYIHGWASSGLANKANQLKKFFGDDNVYAPTLPVNGDLAIHLLEQNIKLMKDFYNITLVGSSLGGFYSIYLSEKYNLKAVLINPSTNSHITLSAYVGDHKNFDGSSYNLIQEQVDLYKKYYVEEIKSPQNFLVLLQTADTVLDYKLAEAKFKNGGILDIEEGGSHVYDGFDTKLEKIKAFSNQNN